MKLLVYGAREFGRLIRPLVLHCGHEFLGFVDDFDVNGPEVLGPYVDVLRSHPPATDLGLIIAIGYNHLEARRTAWVRARTDGYATPALVHRTAMLAPSAEIGEGAIVMAGANVDAFAAVGRFCVLWPGAIVSHDSKLGENCFLSPGAVICGFVTTGASCFFGAGSVTVDHRTVPDRAFIKAGTVYK